MKRETIKNAFTPAKSALLCLTIIVFAIAYLAFCSKDPVASQPPNRLAIKTPISFTNTRKDSVISAFQRSYGSRAHIDSSPQSLIVTISAMGSKSSDVYNNNDALLQVSSKEFSLVRDNRQDKVVLKLGVHGSDKDLYVTLPNDILLALAQKINDNHGR